MSKYWPPIRNLGGIALILFAAAWLFLSLRGGITDERVANSVLVQSIPFVLVFIGILLLFILTIMLVAMRLNGKVPNRAYRPIELTIIAGILFGVLALFQPFHFVGYKYGFVMLLGATLSFILWSHVIPRRARADLALPPITPLHHLLGLAAGVVVVALLAGSAIAANAPQEPYGQRQRLWDSFDEARKAEIRDAALADFNGVEAPFLIAFYVLPGLLAYFAVRELAGLALPAASGAAARGAPLRGTT